MLLVRSSIDGIGPPPPPAPPRPACPPPPPPGACASAGRDSVRKATAPSTVATHMNVMHRFNMKVSSRPGFYPRLRSSTLSTTLCELRRGKPAIPLKYTVNDTV